MRKESIIINVIFDPGKGNITVSSREAVKGQPFGALPRPVRTGYSFEGWYLNGEAVSEETMVESEEDICLVARWAKKKGNRKTSMLKKQKLAVALLSAVTAILILTLFVVNHIVAIYGLVDTYYDDSGVEYTEKYYVKKKQGVYGLYDRNGDLMSVNSDGYYIAHSGNQYKVDAETGEYSLYAVVDYDKAGGEDLGYSDRILMFPQITQKNTYSIEVKNQYGGYTFYRDENGDVHIKGTEEAMVSYDQTLFARLCVSCGYTLTMQKLDFTSEKSNAPRLEDGSIDYSAYGLVDRYDAEGNLTYTPAQYTITQAIYADDGTCTADPDTVYTVKVGDAILSGGGYYVQLEGRDSVYILSSTLQATVLQPIESMVTPMVSSPTTITSQAMLINFLLGTVDVSKAPESKEDADALNITPITSFSYQDLEMRTKTLYSAIPYVSHMDLLKGYEINGERVNEALVLIHQMEFLSCKKLGITADALREYGLAENVYYLSFGAPVLAEDNSIDYYIENTMLISQKTENNTYYIASFLSDMIVEVDQYYLSFLEWDQKEWYHLYIFDYDASYIKELSIRIGDKNFDFIFDNSESDQSEKVNHADLKVLCEQYLKGKDDPHLLDYSITYSYMTDKGLEKTATMSAMDNFWSLYETLLYFSMEGSVDFEELESNVGKSMKDFIADEDNCYAEIYYHAEDLAATMNQYTYKDANGNEVKLYTENNVRYVVLRFYRYSERKSLLTLELIENFDEDGNPISDPTKATGAFYVLTSYLETIMKETQMLLDQIPIEPKGTVINQTT